MRQPIRGRAVWCLASLFTLVAIGDVVAYWVSETAGPSLRRIGFQYTEMPALTATTVLLARIDTWQIRRGRERFYPKACSALEP